MRFAWLIGSLGLDSAVGRGQTAQAAGAVVDCCEAEPGDEVGSTAESEYARDARVGH
jgi:hypothetical protein